MEYITEQNLNLSESEVLIVDDDSISTSVLEELLSGLYKTKTVHSGESALQYCQATPPDLILLDVVMKGISGIETCKALKKNSHTQHIPIIFITSVSDQDEQNLCWEAGGTDYAVKPINGITLRNRIRVHLTHKLQSDLFRRMSFIDALTGLYNRHQLEDAMLKLTSHVNRSTHPLSLIMLDVDMFKNFNDTYGHIVGDECLKSIANVIKDCMHRPTDMGIRYGGDEFLCLLPDTDLNGAKHIAGLILSSVQQLAIEHNKSETNKVTISIGIHTIVKNKNDSLIDSLAKADEALYSAKQLGRNRYAVFDSNIVTA